MLAFRVSMPSSIPSLTFPNLLPSFIRSVPMPTYPTKRNQFDDGSVQVLLTGIRPAGSKLVLTYDKANEGVVGLVQSFYRQTFGTFKSFFLPNTIFDRFPASVKAQIIANQFYAWRFAREPEITTHVTNTIDGLMLADITIELESVVQ